MTRPVLIGSEIYRGSSYGGKHPLAIPRVSTTLDLIAALGWKDPARYRDSPQATPEQLARFHTPDYIAALQEAERTQSVPEHIRARHRIGADGNPIYREMFRRPATGAGAALLAAELTRHGGVVHAPGVGTHHGRPDRASGFCYLNDCVLGILAWLDQGLTRILYVDLDAHHGDGVEDAFHGDPRVFTLSVHEAGRWPGTGREHDTAGGHAANLPVPEGFHDAEFDALLHEAILPIAEAFRPQAIMLQCGADAVEEDPLSRLALTNAAHRAALRALLPLAPRLVVTGGGGYNPWAVARCWAGLWGALDGHDLPDRLPLEAEEVLRGITWHRAAGRNPPWHWFATLADAPPPPRPVRPALRALARRVAARAIAVIG
ncbi:MAG: acetoin utilization protein AcuC [Acetobacteraceae bacterium]|nr:acetoin utilization protein AcuC [Acetobacteraceae bacterium]MDW8396976.1 acetoin utilization protein AcuC [Acetobacteraceae bacterium]